MAHRTIYTLFELAELQAAADHQHGDARPQFDAPMWFFNPGNEGRVDEMVDDLVDYVRAEADAGRAVIVPVALVIRLALAVIMAATLLTWFG